MYFHKNGNVLYLAFPRTASMATSNALVTQLGFTSSLDHHGRFHRALALYPISEDTMVISTVRNHFDWLVSYAYLCSKIPLTVKHLESITSRKLAYIDTDGRLFDYHRLQSTHITRYETLVEDINRFLAGRGFGKITIPRFNDNLQRKERKYQPFYTTELRSWVERKFGEEMEELGYSWED